MSLSDKDKEDFAEVESAIGRRFVEGVKEVGKFLGDLYLGAAVAYETSRGRGAQAQAALQVINESGYRGSGLTDVAHSEGGLRVSEEVMFGLPKAGGRMAAELWYGDKYERTLTQQANAVGDVLFGATMYALPFTKGVFRAPAIETNTVTLYRVVSQEEYALIRQGKFVESSDPALAGSKLAWTSEEMAKNWRASRYYTDAERAGLTITQIKAPKNAVVPDHFEYYGVNAWAQRVSIDALNKQAASQGSGSGSARGAATGSVSAAAAANGQTQKEQEEEPQ